MQMAADHGPRINTKETLKPPLLPPTSSNASCVQSSFSLVSPTSAVCQVIVGGAVGGGFSAGGAASGGGGAGESAAAPKEDEKKKEESEEEEGDFGFDIFG